MLEMPLLVNVGMAVADKQQMPDLVRHESTEKCRNNCDIEGHEPETCT